MKNKKQKKQKTKIKNKKKKQKTKKTKKTKKKKEKKTFSYLKDSIMKGQFGKGVSTILENKGLCSDVSLYIEDLVRKKDFDDFKIELLIKVRQRFRLWGLIYGGQTILTPIYVD